MKCFLSCNGELVDEKISDYFNTVNKEKIKFEFDAKTCPVCKNVFMKAKDKAVLENLKKTGNNITLKL